MILLIDCPDQTGIISQATGVIAESCLNIIKNDEFVESESNHFFMRTELAGDCDRVALEKELKQVLPKGANIEIAKTENKKVVVFATKDHQHLGDILLRYEYDELSADVLAVISNHNTLQPLVAKFGIPFHYISTKGLTREEHEGKILQALSIYNPEYLILAKYMRILTPDFVSKYPNKIINIHHSFLPAFKGANPYRQAFQRGVKIVGATAHFVNNDLDEGPIIFQDVIRIDHRYAVKDIAKAGKDIEKIVLAKALKLVFENRVFIRGNKTVVF